MIKLTKLNDEEVVVNVNQIQSINLIPETKIIFVNKEFLIVKETVDQIVNRVIEFNGKVYNFHKRLTIQDENDAEIRTVGTGE